MDDARYTRIIHSRLCCNLHVLYCIAWLYFYSPDVASFHFLFTYYWYVYYLLFIISFIIIGLLLREALDRLRVRLKFEHVSCFRIYSVHCSDLFPKFLQINHALTFHPDLVLEAHCISAVICTRPGYFSWCERLATFGCWIRAAWVTCDSLGDMWAAK